MSGKMYLVAREVTEDEVVDRKGGLRLTNVMRDSVVKKALEHAFGKREEKLKAEEHAIAHLFMVKAFGHAKLEAARVLGEPWVVQLKDGYGNPVPDGLPMNWRVGLRHVQIRHLDPVPRHPNHTEAKHFSIKDAALVERSEKWQDACQVLEAERTKASNTLVAMLQSISTFKSLETQWPEGKQFFKHLPKDFPYRHQVPATLVSELNKTLGI